MLPGPALAPLAEAGRLDARVKTIAALWRAPERLAAAAPWQRDAALVDVASFGEIGLLASRRGRDGMPAPIPYGAIGAPRGAAGAVRWPRPRARARHAGAARAHGAAAPSRPAPSAGGAPDGFIDTGFTCASKATA